MHSISFFPFYSNYFFNVCLSFRSDSEAAIAKLKNANIKVNLFLTFKFTDFIYGNDVPIICLFNELLRILYIVSYMHPTQLKIFKVP